MEKQVVVLCSKRDGAFILHPMGTFEGHGAYVGMFSYRSATSDCDDVDLGNLAIDLLSESGSSGWHIRDIVKYQTESLGDGSRNISDKYLPTESVSDAFIANSFVYIDVGQKKARSRGVFVAAKDLTGR